MTCVVLSYLLLAAGTVDAPNKAGVYALIVTNNSSLDLSRPELHYADDDGLAYATLFRQLAAPDNVQLLTSLDAATSQLQPGWVGQTKSPSLKNLRDAVAHLAASLQERQKNGLQSQVYLVFAGHGDVANGEGFVELEDGRLTSSALSAEIIGRLPAAHIHLILDSCNSYFMLNPRKAGGRRFKVTATTPKGLLEQHPNLGAIVSTSAEALTYEWSEIQSGIFSYIVRSGLRGAADANSNQAISYNELAAFADTAAAAVPNDLYRPKVFFQGPHNNNDATFLAFSVPLSKRVLRLEKGASARITIRNSLGSRLLDLHKTGDSDAIVWLPEDDDLDIAHATVGREVPVVVKHFRAPTSGSFSLASLQIAASPPSSRGNAPVFSSLFNEPFGPKVVAEFVAHRDQSSTQVYGVSSQDVARLDAHLRTLAGLGRDSRMTAGIVSLVAGATLGLMAPIGANEVSDPQVRKLFLGLTIGGGSAFALMGSLALAIPSNTETLYEQFSHMEFDTEVKRAENFAQAEAQLEATANMWSQTRMLVGGGALVSGLGLGFVGGLNVGRAWSQEQKPALSWYLCSGLGLGLMGLGAYALTGFRYPVERVWQLYQGDGIGSATMSETSELSLAPSLSIGGNSLAIGFEGRF